MGMDTRVSPQRVARGAGALYLIVVVFSVYALTVVSSIVAASDPATTVANLTREAGRFRVAVVANLIATLCYIGVVGLLNELMRPVHAGISRIAMLFGLAGCMMGALTVVLELSGTAMAASSGGLASGDLIQLLNVASRRGNSVGLTMFGVYCLLLGWLVLRSRFLPRVLGALLILSGVTWLTANLAVLAWPDLGGELMWTVGVAALGEIAFTIWLLLKGVDEVEWHRQSSENCP